LARPRIPSVPKYLRTIGGPTRFPSLNHNISRFLVSAA
jgi:hypothetical protein